MSLTERLTRLTDVLVALSGSPIPTHLFQTVADLAPTAVPCDYLAVCLPTPDGSEPGYLVHSLAALPRDVSGEVWAPDQGIAGRVMRSGRASVVNDLAAMDGATAFEEILARAGLRAVLAVPVRRGVDVAGALLFARRPPGTYDQEDVQIAALIAAGLGSSLESSRVYQALADERSTLAAVLGSTSDAVVMVNEDGVVLLANPAVGPMLGLVPDAMVGRRLTDIPGHESLLGLFEQSRARTIELPLSDARTAQASLVSVVTPYGEPVGVAAVLRDITLFKNLERMKNEFVNTVSHDLKNPISIIDGTAQLMLMSGPGDREEPRSHPAHLHRGPVHGGSRRRSPRPREDRGWARSAKGAARRRAARQGSRGDDEPQAEDKGITIALEATAAWVSAAPARLTQALLNLVGNAVKYTPAGGRVTVSVVASADTEPLADATVTIRVADTGVGIPACHLPHVFEKFYRVHDASTKGIPGTGLGLAITKSIVESHGGQIRVESVEGVGSVFLVELPACPAGSPQADL